MRYLAIDLGDKRTGLAAGDDETKLVSPLTVLEVPRGEALLEAIIEQIAEQGADAIVVGLPLHMDGTEGERAKIARTFGEQVRERTGKPVEYQDERLTSYAADGRMAQTGRTHKKKKQLRDALAAAEILRDYLNIAG